MVTPRLSILVPAITDRVDAVVRLLRKLQNQAGDSVEILSLVDNRKRSTGRKRDDLLQLATGEYVAFVDDDDDVAGNYTEAILDASRVEPDVIVFDHLVWLNGEGPFRLRPGLEHENEEAHKVNGVWSDITRKPWHTCAWRTEIARQEHFPDLMYGEDWHWASRVIPRARTQARIERALYYYRYSRLTTACEGATAT